MWQGKLIDMPDLPHVAEVAIEAVMNRLSTDYPSVASLNVAYGDPEWMEDQLATKSNTSIYLNKTYWTNLGKFDAVAKDWHEARVATDFAGVIIHEVGHVISVQIMSKLGSRKFNAMVEKYIGKGNFNSISNEVSPSAYGQENVFEFLAESFSAAYLGKSALERENDLSLQALAASRALWAEFNKVLHGSPKKGKLRLHAKARLIASRL